MSHYIQEYQDDPHISFSLVLPVLPRLLSHEPELIHPRHAIQHHRLRPQNHLSTKRLTLPIIRAKRRPLHAPLSTKNHNHSRSPLSVKNRNLHHISINKRQQKPPICISLRQLFRYVQILAFEIEPVFCEVCVRVQTGVAAPS